MAGMVIGRVDSQCALNELRQQPTNHCATLKIIAQKCLENLSGRKFKALCLRGGLPARSRFAAFTW